MTNKVKKSSAFTPAGERSSLLNATKRVQFSPRNTKAAFTLAEVLITLGIIGVVAALTLPTLIQNYEKKETCTRLKKAYTILYQAVELSEITNGDKENWDYGLSSKDFIDTYLSPFMKISEKDARLVNNKTIYKNLDGTVSGTWAFTHPDTYTITLPDGMILFVDTWYPNNKTYRTVSVDINGYKKPNMLGKDLFIFSITSYTVAKVLPSEIQRKYPGNKNPTIIREDLLNNNEVGSCTKKHVDQAGFYCSAVIMADGWKIKDDYPW